MSGGLDSGAVTVRLPTFDATGSTTVLELSPPGPWTRPAAPLTSRVAFAAAHVVPRTAGDNTPGRPADLDWDATLAYRHRIWEHGLGVAEAMDTAQRGMGLDWPATQELVRRAGAEARSAGGRIAAGAGTDQLVGPVPPGRAGLETITRAYREQVAVVAGAGAQVVLMASRALAGAARSAQDYLQVYDAVLSELSDGDGPVVLHWLGAMFDPALAGYWGSDDVATATETFVELVQRHGARIDGVKVSLLDAEHEVGLRRRLAQVAGPGGRPVRLYTGDDFHYPDLIAGDAEGHSDALLGVFAAIYPAASTALQAFDAGDPARGRAVLASTEALGRHLFAAPTYYYKTGIAFLSWLNGHQPGFVMVGGLHAGRSVRHLVELVRLADSAGLLLDPELAARRTSHWLAVNGWEV